MPGTGRIITGPRGGIARRYDPNQDFWGVEASWTSPWGQDSGYGQLTPIPWTRYVMPGKCCLDPLTVVWTSAPITTWTWYHPKAGVNGQRQIAIRLQLATDAAFSSIVFDTGVLNYTPVSYRHSGLTPGKYYRRLMVGNGAANVYPPVVEAWSDYDNDSFWVAAKTTQSEVASLFRVWPDGVKSKIYVPFSSPVGTLRYGDASEFEFVINSFSPFVERDLLAAHDFQEQSGDVCHDLFGTNDLQLASAGSWSSGQLNLGGGNYGKSDDLAMTLSDPMQAELAVDPTGSTGTLWYFGSYADDVNYRKVDYHGARKLRVGASKRMLNMFQRSEEFDNAYWTKTNLSVMANDQLVANPVDGLFTADYIYENAETTVQRYVLRAMPLVAGRRYTVSIYVRPAQRTILFPTFNSAFGINKSFATAQVGFNTNYLSYAVWVNTALQDAGAGWYRVFMSGLATASVTASLCFFLNSAGLYAGKYFTGTAAAGGDTTHTLLPAGASAVDDYYNGARLYVAGEPSGTQWVYVTDYNGASKTLTHSALSAAADGKVCTITFGMNIFGAQLSDGEDTVAYQATTTAAVEGPAVSGDLDLTGSGPIVLNLKDTGAYFSAKKARESYNDLLKRDGATYHWRFRDALTTSLHEEIQGGTYAWTGVAANMKTQVHVPSIFPDEEPCARFAGASTDYISTTILNGYNPYLGAVSYDGWIKFNKVNAAQFPFDQSNGANKYLYIGVSFTGYWGMALAASGYTVAPVGPVAKVGTWYYWAVVASGNNGTLYVGEYGVDAAPVAVVSKTLTSFAFDHGLQITNRTVTYPTQGLIPSFAVYVGHALTADEMLSHYTYPQGAVSVPTPSNITGTPRLGIGRFVGLTGSDTVDAAKVSGHLLHSDALTAVEEARQLQAFRDTLVHKGVTV